MVGLAFFLSFLIKGAEKEHLTSSLSMFIFLSFYMEGKSMISLIRMQSQEHREKIWDNILDHLDP